MKLTLRQKMNALVGAVVAVFLSLIAVNWYLSSQANMQTLIIRNKYIPLVELGYRVEAKFESITLALRDAVSTQDQAGLEQAVAYKNELISEIENAHNLIDSKDAQEVKLAIERYFSTALATSHRIIKGEAGIEIVEAMTDMQAKRATARTALMKITAFDRAKIGTAFTTIADLQQRSTMLRLWVSLIAVILITVGSIAVGRAFIARLRVISSGLSRFGEGNFVQLIPVTGYDELSHLSTQINTMAMRIQGLVKEIEAFSYSVAHDLRAPVRGILGFANALQEDYGQQIPEEGRSYLDRISNAAKKMGHMIDGLLGLSRLNRATILNQDIDLSKMVMTSLENLKESDKGHFVQVQIADNVHAKGDPKLLDVVITNLISNAWKFTRHVVRPRIEFGVKQEGYTHVFYISDNGAGFDMKYKDKLFGTFQRLHSESEFEGHGIGLATVKQIIEKHGGRIWAESEVGKGSTFYFTLEQKV